MTAGSSGGHDSVVFDLDGVVLDSRAAFARCINVALAENGLQPRESDELARFLGPSLHEAFLELTEALASLESAWTVTEPSTARPPRSPRRCSPVCASYSMICAVSCPSR